MLISLALSLALHLLLMLFLSRMSFPPPRLFALQADKPKRAPTIQTIDLRELAKPKLSPNARMNQKATTEIKSELAEIGEQAIREMLQKENLLTPKPPPSLRFAGVDKAILTPKLPNAEPPRQATAPRPQIVAIDFNDLPPSRQAARRNDMIPGVERIDVPNLHLPSLLPHGPLTGSHRRHLRCRHQTGPQSEIRHSRWHRRRRHPAPPRRRPGLTPEKRRPFRRRQPQRPGHRLEQPR